MLTFYKGCTLSANLSDSYVYIYTNGLIAASCPKRIAGSNGGGKHIVSGLVFADDLVGIYIRNTLRIAETIKGRARIYTTVGNGG